MKPVIPPRIVELLEEAARALPGEVKPESAFDGGEVFTVEDQLRLGISLAETEEKRQELQGLLARLRAAYRGMGGRTAQSVAFVRNTKFYAYLTLLPASAVGKSVRLEHLYDLLAEMEVAKGLDRAAVDAAFAKAAQRHELVWDLRIAEGILPERGKDARLEYLVRHLDHALLFGEDPAPVRPIGECLEPVEPQQVLARVHPPEPGKGGMLVTGKKLSAPHGRELETLLGAGVRLSRRTGDLIAQVHGCVVVTAAGVDVTPFLRRDAAAGAVWTVDDPERPAIEFDGSVYIRGGATGPGRIRARDAYVDGDLVDVEVEIERDLYVSGSIASPSGVVVRAGGRVRARAARRARIDALGPVTFRDAVEDSEVRSADSIRVGIDGRGLVRSGRLEAMNRIVASLADAEGGGPGVSFTVGSSSLLDERLGALAAADRANEATRREITRRKLDCLGDVLDPGALPADRQDHYLELLRRETAALEAQRKLRAEIERLRTSCQPSGAPRVDVRRRFHPPGRVRVATAELAVETLLEGPRFILGKAGSVLIDSVRPATAVRRAPAAEEADESAGEGSR